MSAKPILVTAVFAASLAIFTPSEAQVSDAIRKAPSPTTDTQVGKTAQVNSGRVGQRQSRDDQSSQVNVQPLARTATRISNRVQTRIRNRVDRNYDPQANAASPFSVAADQIRSVNQARR